MDAPLTGCEKQGTGTAKLASAPAVRTQPLIRSARVARVAFAGAAIVASLGLAGCRWWPLRQQSGIPVYTESLTKEGLVASLNRNIEPIAAWRCTDARVKTPGIMGVEVGAHIAVERPRNFRMKATALGKGVADLGSNDERFWFWFDGHPDRRTFTARHEDTEYAQRVLQIPFEPDWLLEVLGVVPLNPDDFEMIGDAQDTGTVSLVSERKTAGGRIVRRVVLVDTRHRVITAHALFDATNAARPMAKATLTNHRRDPQTGLVLPYRIDLDWPQAKLSMTLTLNHVEINPQNLPEPMWAMPAITGYPAYEIASPVPDQFRAEQTAMPFHAAPTGYAGEFETSASPFDTSSR